MAGLGIRLCLPPGSTDGIVAAVDVAMAPFESMRGFAAERDQWASWRIAGGADGAGFWIAAGAEDDPRIIHDQPHWRTGAEPSLPGMCAGGPRGLLDLHRPARDAEHSAERLWDLYHQLRPKLPAVVPREHFLQLPENNLPFEPDNLITLASGLVVSRGQVNADNQYLEQPIMRELRASPFWQAGAMSRAYDIMAYFDLSREQYVAARMEETRPFDALLTLDGWWVEIGYPPVHGACDDLDACPHRHGMTQPWTSLDIERYLQRMPDDVVIVRLRCHV